jgi:hypothetical protein
MKEYYIAYEPLETKGRTIPKYNIYYYYNNMLEGKEYHSSDGKNGYIKPEYKLKTK